MNGHIVFSKFAKPGHIWVEKCVGEIDKWEVIQVPASDIQKYIADEDYFVLCCRQGYCRDKGVVFMDSYYPYMSDHNHCKHCAEVLMDYKEKADD